MNREEAARIEEAARRIEEITQRIEEATTKRIVAAAKRMEEAARRYEEVEEGNKRKEQVVEEAKNIKISQGTLTVVTLFIADIASNLLYNPLVGFTKSGMP
ncbi:hypothetical protein P8452_32564 [Trifolium repens]|nr:hypothetical protein P8452_32564 [Trifolium repens]